MTKLHRAYSALDIKDVSDEKRIIRGIATTPRPDRVGDVVDPKGVTVAASIPLFLYHDSRLTVGRTSFGKATAAGIPFEASLPHIAESGNLRDRVEEAWQMVKYQLITGVSIGFRVINDGIEQLKSGGFRFLETEVMELSLVPIPAQPDAVIQGFKSAGSSEYESLLETIKSVDHQTLAALGLRAKSVQLIRRSPGASGNSIAHPGAVQLIKKDLK